MKLIETILVMLFICPMAWSQKIVELHEDLNNKDQIKIEFKFADSILVQKWDNNEIYVKSTVSINGDKDNDKFVFNIKTKENTLIVESEIKDLDKIGKHRKVQDVVTGEIIEMNCQVDLDLYYEVFLPLDIDVSIETINGNIQCHELNGKQKIHTISGDIDYYCSENKKADLEFSTISGEVYSDFNLNSNEGEYSKYGFNKLNYKLNGGGIKLELETISGDIYFRKAQ